MKTVFTTGDVAKICKVSQQTIIRCFDSGQLKGFRVPGSRFRRIPRDQLYKFMRENGIPTDDLEGENDVRVLILTSDNVLAEKLRDAMPKKERFDVVIVDNPFDAGLRAVDSTPDALIVDCLNSVNEACALTELLRKYPDFDRTIVIALVPKKSRPTQPQATTGIEIYKKPFDPKLLAASLLETVKEQKNIA